MNAHALSGDNIHMLDDHVLWGQRAHVVIGFAIPDLAYAHRNALHAAHVTIPHVRSVCITLDVDRKTLFRSQFSTITVQRGVRLIELEGLFIEAPSL